jgi:hypothetical protein
MLDLLELQGKHFIMLSVQTISIIYQRRHVMQVQGNMKQSILTKKLEADIFNKINSQSRREKEIFSKCMIIQDLVNINLKQQVALLVLSLKKLILIQRLLIAIVLLNIISQGHQIILIALISGLNIKIIWILNQFIKETNLEEKENKFSE